MKEFNLTATIGDIIGDIKSFEDKSTILLVNDAGLDLHINVNKRVLPLNNEVEQVNAEIYNISGSYENDNGRIKIILNENPLLMVRDFSGNEIIQQPIDMIEYNLIDKNVDVNDNGLGSLIAEFLKNLDEGLYE